MMGPSRRCPTSTSTFGKGEFVSFIGPSGCGKTTLLRVIADLEQPTSGTISVNGVSPEEARQGRAYGYVFQAAALYPWRTIERNVAPAAGDHGLVQSRTGEARRARRWRWSTCRASSKKYPWQLSGGMQQRVSIARALAFDADLLLMDEPFGALDEIVRDHLNEQLLELWAATEKTDLLRHPLEFRKPSILSTRIVVMSPRPGRVTMSSNRRCRASGRSTSAKRRSSWRSPHGSAMA